MHALAIQPLSLKSCSLDAAYRSPAGCACYPVTLVGVVIGRQLTGIASWTVCQSGLGRCMVANSSTANCLDLSRLPQIPSILQSAARPGKRLLCNSNVMAAAATAGLVTCRSYGPPGDSRAHLHRGTCHAGRLIQPTAPSNG